MAWVPWIIKRRGGDEGWISKMVGLVISEYGTRNKPGEREVVAHRSNVG